MELRPRNPPTLNPAKNPPFPHLVSEPHLAARVAADVHSAEEDPALLRSSLRRGWRRVVFRTGASASASAACSRVRVLLRPSPSPVHELGLDGGVVLLVDYVVHAVAVDQQVLLKDMQRLEENGEELRGVLM